MQTNFLRTIVGLGVAAVVGLVPARPAAAQSTGIIPLRAKVGVFLPQGDVKNFAGSTGFNAEVDVALPSLGGGRTFLSAGYYRDSHNGQSVTMVPVTIGRLFSPPNPVSSVTGNVYYGLGVGAYFLRARGGGVSASTTRPGGYALLGYQFPNPYFVEAKYHVAGSVNGISPHGLVVMLGRHF